MEMAKIIYRLPCPEKRPIYLRFRDLERLANNGQRRKGVRIRLTERVLFDIL